MCNQDIRHEAMEAEIRLWQIADRLAIADNAFSRKLRKELPPEQKERIRGIIADLKAGEAHG